MKDKCSVWAFEEIKSSGHLGDLQSAVLSVIVDAYPEALQVDDVVSGARERLGKNVRAWSIFPRFAELEDRGFILKKKIALNESTKKEVNTWIYTGRRTPYELKIEFAECVHCDGKGKSQKTVWFNPDSGTTQSEIF